MPLEDILRFLRTWRVSLVVRVWQNETERGKSDGSISFSQRIWHKMQPAILRSSFPKVTTKSKAGTTPDPNFLESHPLNIRRTLQPGLSLVVRSEAAPRIDWDQLLARSIDGSSMRLDLGGYRCVTIPSCDSPCKSWEFPDPRGGTSGVQVRAPTLEFWSTVEWYRQTCEPSLALVRNREH